MNEFDLIETPENVELRQRLAGLGTRFAAGVLDHLLLWAVQAVVMLGLLLGQVVTFGQFGDFGWVLMVAVFGLVFAYLAYFIGWEYGANGQTPGKMVLRIRVVREGGGSVTFPDVAVRNLLRLVDGFPLVIAPVIAYLPAFYAVAAVSMFVSRKFQRLGDLAAGTVVISEAIDAVETGARARQAARIETSPEALRATGLKPEEYRVIHSYWRRRAKIRPAARGRFLPGLLRPVLARQGASVEGLTLGQLDGWVDHLMRQAIEAERGPEAAAEALASLAAEVERVARRAAPRRPQSPASEPAPSGETPSEEAPPPGEAAP